VADPAPTTARPAPTQPTTRRARKQARAAAAAAAKASAAQAAAAAKASAAQAAAAAKAAAAQAAAEAAAAKASAKASAKATKATKAAKAAPEPVSPLRAGSIEGEVLSESTQPTSGAPDSRRGRSKDRPLRKGEREHIDWVTQLVQIEHDSVLKTSKER
jgi:membrane protein involved in colicin uptake